MTLSLSVTGKPLGVVTVNPKRQNAGQYVTVRVTGSAPKATLTVQLDGTGPAATIKTNGNGVGSTSFFVRTTTAKGLHQVVVTLPGRTDDLRRPAGARRLPGGDVAGGGPGHDELADAGLAVPRVVRGHHRGGSACP